MPFSHGSPGPYSTYNARIGIQYVQYLKLYGGTTNFDGAGPGGMHNASGNNTSVPLRLGGLLRRAGAPTVGPGDPGGQASVEAVVRRGARHDRRNPCRRGSG